MIFRPLDNGDEDHGWWNLGGTRNKLKCVYEVPQWQNALERTILEFYEIGWLLRMWPVFSGLQNLFPRLKSAIDELLSGLWKPYSVKTVFSRWEMPNRERTDVIEDVGTLNCYIALKQVSEAPWGRSNSCCRQTPSNHGIISKSVYDHCILSGLQHL